MKVEKRQRIKWVDELKGAILIVICMGHIAGMVFTPPTIQYIANLLTIIGVPTFFFLSGLLYISNDTALSLKSYCKRKAKSLLIPYILLSMLFTLFDPYTFKPSYLVEVLHYPRLTLPVPLGAFTQASIEFFIGDILCTVVGISSRATLPLWFVFVLYVVTISYFWIYDMLRSQIKMGFLAVIFMMVAFVLCWLGIGATFKIGPILMAFFFYWLGVVFSKRMQWFDKPAFIMLPFLFVFLFVFFMTAPSLIDSVSFVNGIFPFTRPFLFLVSSLAGISCFLLLFAVLSRCRFWGFNILKGILRNIARNSLIVLAMHYVLLVFFSLYIKHLIPAEWHMWAAFFFIIVGCIVSIALFRTKLYMFIGGKRAKQDLETCLSIRI